MSSKRRVEIAVELVEAWNRLGVRYAVVHGIDDYPATVGRDLDILVHVDDSSALLTASHQILEREGWVAIEPPDMWGSRIVAFSDQDGLELHTVTRLSWREIDLASSPHPARRTKNMFPMDPWASYAKQILMPGFHGDLTKMSSNAAALHLVESDRELVQHGLQALVLPGDEALAISLPDRSAEELETLLPTVRSSMVKRSWRRTPLSAVRSVSRKVGQRLEGLIRATGVTVQLVAVDEIDPNDVVQWIKSTDTSVFTDFLFRMPVSGLRQSKLGLLIDATRRFWLRLVADRAPLSGQRVVFHLVEAVSYDIPSGGVIQRFSRWLDRVGSQPEAFVVIGRTRKSIGQAGWIAVSGEDPGVAATEIVRVAIEAFIRRHSPAK